MEKRVFLAIALSLLVLTLYQAYLAPPPPKATPAPATVTEQQPPAAGATPANAPAGTAAPAIGASNPTVVPVPVSPDARDIVVDTDSVHAVFSTQVV